MNRRRLTAGALLLMLVAAGSTLAGRAEAQSTPAAAAVKSTAATKPAKSSAKAGSSSTATPSAPQTITVGPVADVDAHKAFGSKSAPVIMETFSDFQCPACKNLYLGTNRQVMDNYVTTGKVYLVHRDYPLPMHAHSKVAASYARAAAYIGRVEPVEQALFQNQEKWEATGDVDGTVATAVSAADMKKIRDLVKAATLEPLIAKDVELAKVHNVTQTPTTIFYAHGQTYPYAGQINYEFLKQFLDQLLAQK